MCCIPCLVCLQAPTLTAPESPEAGESQVQIPESGGAHPWPSVLTRPAAPALAPSGQGPIISQARLVTLPWPRPGQARPTMAPMLWALEENCVLQQTNVGQDWDG